MNHVMSSTPLVGLALLVLGTIGYAKNRGYLIYHQIIIDYLHTINQPSAISENTDAVGSSTCPTCSAEKVL